MADNNNRTRLFPGLSKQLQSQTPPGTKPASASAAEQKRTVIPFRQLPEDPGPGPKTWSDDDSRHRRRSHRGILLLALVLLLATVIALVIWSSSTDFSAMRRSYTYRGVARDDRGVTETHSLPVEQSVLSCMGRRTAVASRLGLEILDEDNSVLASCVAAMEDPVLHTSEKLSLAYDAGGKTVCVINSAMESKTITADAPLLTADAAKGGSFCYLTSSENDKMVLSVYSENFSEIFRWYSKSRYLTTVSLSDDGQTVAAVGASSKDGVYSSSLLLLRTDSKTPAADIDLGDSLVLWADWIGNACALVCHDQVLFYDAGGTLLGSYAMDGRAVTGAAAGDGYLALSLSEGRTSDRDMLVTLHTDGAVRAELSPGCAAEQLTAAGNYIAVLTPQGLTLYTSDLALYGELAATSPLQRCYARRDGSVLLETGQGIALYLP